MNDTVTAIKMDFDRLTASGDLVLESLIKSHLEVHSQLFSNELDHVGCRHPGGGNKEAPGRIRDMKDVVVAINEKAGGRVFFQGFSVILSVTCDLSGVFDK